ncbi:MAG: sugar ABC transporter permease, partial [Clostridia bacterium]|nr:sugar ABC transporter permease [Clostridia bacterium]
MNKVRKKWSRDDLQLFFLSLPTVLWYVLFCYLPLFGLIIAFKKYQVVPGKGFLYSLMHSEWSGLENFRFLFANNRETTVNMFVNTLGYNLVFIVLDIVLPVTLAIMISNLKSRPLAKTAQTAMFLPHFLSWVV